MIKSKTELRAVKRRAAELRLMPLLNEIDLDELAKIESNLDWYERATSGQELPLMNDLAGIGRLLIALRLAQGITQQELARRLGVTRAQISKDELRQYSKVSVERVARILEALGAKIELRVSQINPSSSLANPSLQKTVSDSSISFTGNTTAKVKFQANEEKVVQVKESADFETEQLNQESQELVFEIEVGNEELQPEEILAESEATSIKVNDDAGTPLNTYELNDIEPQLDETSTVLDELAQEKTFKLQITVGCQNKHIGLRSWAEKSLSEIEQQVLPPQWRLISKKSLWMEIEAEYEIKVSTDAPELFALSAQCEAIANKSKCWAKLNLK